MAASACIRAGCADEDGSEMEALFRRRMLRASSAGSARLMWVVLVALQDLLAGAVAERLPTRRARVGQLRRRREIQGCRA